MVNTAVNRFITLSGLGLFVHCKSGLFFNMRIRYYDAQTITVSFYNQLKMISYGMWACL